MNVICADKNASGPLKLVSRHEYRHPRVFTGVRMGAGVWLLISPPFCTATTAAAGGESC